MSETLLINNTWQSSSDKAFLPVLNPADGSTIAQMAVPTQDDINRAVQSANDAFPIWSALSGRERASIMREASRIYREQYLYESARLLTQENGKPLDDSVKECRYTADVIDFYADESRRITGTHFSGDMGTTHSFVTKQPVGVVGAILPWNFPVDLLAWKIGPGLAAGCTFVIKPSEETPLASALLIQAFVDAGIPSGVLNIVTGGREVGASIVQHPEVHKIAFTGSVPTGQWIAEQAGRQLKRVTLELGGSAPFIVCEDANLDLAIPEALRRTFSHTGQICISVNRIFVHEARYDEYVERFTELASSLRVATNGLDEPSADMGPLMNALGMASVQAHFEDAIEHGAVVLTGGHRLTDGYHPQGHFYAPTVLKDVQTSMRVMQEETFGPIAPIASFTTLDEAIDKANSTPYGLAAYLYTQDLDSAFYASQRLNFGGVGINVNDITDIRGPFGGMKQSGIGRELGEVGLDAYFETKHIRYRYQKPD